MTKIIIVQKGGNLVSKNVNNLDESTFYKKCGLRNDNNFDHRHTWNVNGVYVSLYARDDGKANQENKYDLPPPLDNNLFFNKMLLIKHSFQEYSDGTEMNLSLDEWSNIYENLFGGFESLDNEEEESSEEEIPAELKTKEGYSKEDGFVVDDDEEDGLEYLSSENEILSQDDDDDIYMENDSVGDVNSSCEEDDDDDEESDLESISDDDDDSGNESELTEESYLSD